MKRFVLRDDISKEIKSNLTEYPELIQKVLFHRGIKTSEQAQKYFNPSYEEDVLDAFLFKDMKKAVDRILIAIDKDEKIVIYSDYDADGIPGAIILHDLFKKIGFNNFENYIPHRHDEGFGLNSEAIEEFAKKGAKLVITVDCGIADVAEVAHANKLGIDVVITDHHLPGDILPDAFAIIDHKQKDCKYPEKVLSGAGIAFKLAQAVLRSRDWGIKEGWEKWLLDMAGLATISDMVPLVGENRAIAHYGLKVIRKSPRPGLNKIFIKARVKQEQATEDDIGFSISPKINAASRMGHPLEAFELLRAQTETEAEELATNLFDLNNERKGLVASVVKEIKKRLKALETVKDVIVLGDRSWRAGILGLAANTIAEEYHRPVFIWGGEDGDELKGSCRSPHISVVELMNHAKEIFTNFGGHGVTGGFSLKQERIHELEDKLSTAYRELVKEVKEQVEYIDDILHIDDINFKTYNLLEKCAPFGMENPKPIFLIKDAPVRLLRQFGKNNEHLEVVFEKKNGEKIKAVSFFASPEDFEKKPTEGG